MLPARLHALGRDRPELRLQVDFRPLGADDLARARRRQDAKLKRSSRHARSLAKLVHEARHLGIWDCIMMAAGELRARSVTSP